MLLKKICKKFDCDDKTILPSCTNLLKGTLEKCGNCQLYRPTVVQWESVDYGLIKTLVRVQPDRLRFFYVLDLYGFFS